MNVTPLIKVSSDWQSRFFTIVVLAIVIFVAGIRSVESLTSLFWKGGWLALIIMYLTFQAYSSSWLLFEEKLVVKRPWRPFYNRFEFRLEDIDKLTFTIPNIGKLNPWLKVYCRNKRFKIYDFGFSGDRNKMEQLLSMRKEKGIDVTIKRGTVEET